MHPYKNLNLYQYWSKSFSKSEYNEQKFITNPKFKITKSDRIVTAGSCFAQHIGRALKNENILIQYGELPPSFLTPESEEYEKFFHYSAMYGNVYTIHQFKDLIDQAFELKPMIRDYFFSNESTVDLIRPSVISDKYSFDEINNLRIKHLAAVKKVYSNMDVLLFTFGLTEGWINTQQKYAYPVCPGTVAGEFDVNSHSFVNYSFTQILNQSLEVFNFLKIINKNLKIIVTVSPVALAATFNDKHVSIATCHSKSILRTVVEEIKSELEFVDYFPSYDILTSPASLGRYFKRNLREVNQVGVNFAMENFLNNYIENRNFSSNLISDPECDELFYGKK